MNTEPLIQKINIESIIPNRFQPRLTFDEKALNELAASIKEHGIIQPLVLRRIGDKFEIIAGERRYKAATIAGLTEVPAIISNMDDNKSAEIALVENIQRKNLNSLEEAKSYKKVIDKEGLTQEELSKKMGISQSTIANKLRLLNLTNDAQEALMENKISERHARSLLQLINPEDQIKMLNRVINERLTVRQLDDEIKKITGQIITDEEDTSNSSPSIDANIEEETSAAKDIVPKSANKLLNIFSLPEENQYPSLDDEVTNMNFEPIETLDEAEFNPFNSSKPKNEANIFDHPEEPIEDLKTPEVQVNEEKLATDVKVEAQKKAIEPNNLNSVKKAYQNLAKEIEEAGYKINTEDFDFEDLYQIIIKIDKQAE